MAWLFSGSSGFWHALRSPMAESVREASAEPLPTGTRIRFRVMPVAVSAADLPVLLVHAAQNEHGTIERSSAPGRYWVRAAQGGALFEVCARDIEPVTAAH